MADDYFTEDDIVSTYTAEEAIEDGILMKNPCMDVFPECDILTTNLFETIAETGIEHKVEPIALVRLAMAQGKNALTTEDFGSDDNDEDFFVLKWESLTIWFVRNENGNLTAMLPEDY